MAKKGGPFVNKKLWRAFKSEPYTYEELVGYYKGIYKAYRSLIASKPDAIIVPLRGAFPLIRSVQFFASIEKKSNVLPKIYYSRTGQLLAETPQRIFDKTVRNEAHAIPEKQKLREFGSILKRIKVFSKKKIPHVVLFDEVFGGGSISKSYELIERAAAEKGIAIRLDAMGIASGDHARTANAYTRLRSLKRLKQFEVPRLFTIDNPNFLQPLIERKASKALKGVTQNISPVLAKVVKRALRVEYDALASKRPALGMSKQALDGRMTLLSDLSALHDTPGKASILSRLPSQNHKNMLTKQHTRRRK